MNDEHNHKDPIERLFREKAEQYDISYKEEDWLKLEKQLDARDLQRSYRRKLRLLAAASFLILSLIGYYTFQNYNKINQLAEQLNSNNDAALQTERPQSGEDLILDDEHLMDDNGVEPGDSSVEPSIAESSQDQEENSNSSQNSTLFAGETSTEAPQADQSESLTNVWMAGQEQIISRKHVGASGFYTEQIELPPRFFESLESPVLAEESTNTHWFQSGTDAPYNASLTFGRDGIQSIDQPPYSSWYSRLSIGMVLSPDVSTAGSVSNFYDPGFKAGITAEYAINETFSLTSGAVLSKVKYKASEQAYNPPDYWNAGVFPNETTAVCMVLDIPISLKSDIINFERSRIYATAGVSSYIMLNEEYKFSFENAHPGLVTDWNENTGTRHWASNAGFSVGFEMDLSSKWSLRAEPHIKIPLKGVGWGNVKLYSMGSFFSLNYKL